MVNENYRYYCLDRAGHLHDADWFYAKNDEAAVAHIKAEHQGDTCEIWQRGRLVAKLEPVCLSA